MQYIFQLKIRLFHNTIHVFIIKCFINCLCYRRFHNFFSFVVINKLSPKFPHGSRKKPCLSFFVLFCLCPCLICVFSFHIYLLFLPQLHCFVVLVRSILLYFFTSYFFCCYSSLSFGFFCCFKNFHGEQIQAAEGKGNCCLESLLQNKKKRKKRKPVFRLLLCHHKA